MSKKRPSAESCRSTEEPTSNDGAASVFPQDDNAKRVKLMPCSDTTLQDLPIELIEFILIKVVAMEVKSMKLSKRVWKEKAELVINRLADVCLQWSSVLSTGGFRTRLHRALEAQGTIRLEILKQYSIQFPVSGVTALRDEVFLLCPGYLQDHIIIVYDCHNMPEVKDVIPLPGLNPQRIVACNMSNCLYIVNRTQYDHFSIIRITRDNDGCWSTVSELIKEQKLPDCSFCVSPIDGSLIISREQTKRHPSISVYDAVAGSLQKQIRLPFGMTGFSEIIPKPNGNLVLRGISYNNNDDNYDNDYDYSDYSDDDDDNNDGKKDDGKNDDGKNDDGKNDDDDDDNDDDSNDDHCDDVDNYTSSDYSDDDDDYVRQAKFTEIDMNGTKIRRYLCPLGKFGTLGLHASIVDSHGRMLTVSDKNGVQLLDSEFNPMDFTCPQLIDLDSSMFTSLLFHYNSDRKETILIDKRFLVNPGAYTVFRLKEL